VSAPGSAAAAAAAAAQGAIDVASPQAAIDVHSHMLCPEWLELIRSQ